MSMAIVLLAAAFANSDKWIIISRQETDSECLIGIWMERFSSRDLQLEKIVIRMTGSGTVYSFRPDRTASIDFGAGVVESGVHNDHLVTLHFTGTIEYRYQIDDGVIYQDVMMANATRAFKIDDTIVNEKPLDIPTGTTGARSFTCSADRLELRSGSDTYELERLSRS